MNGSAIAAAAISLPTTGAKVTSTSLQAASGAGANAVGEYCKVLGSISPVDQAAPPINFQLNLPTAWNGKTLHLMGGGFDGVLVTGTGGVPGAAGIVTPLGKGYATFGSDAGHTGNPMAGPLAALDGSFALNQEAFDNFLGDQLRKTRDVVTQLISTRYGRAPSKSYAAGSSNGGREALYVADRWPALYDGVIAFYPAWLFSPGAIRGSRVSKALAAPGAWSNLAKQDMVFNAVTAACDALDGVSDGIVSNVAACRFDPQALRCSGGADTGDSCLSDAQIGGFNALASTTTLPFPLNGSTSVPGLNVFNAAANMTVAGIHAGMGARAPATPTTLDMSWAILTNEANVRYMITGDADYDALKFDITSAGYFQQRVKYISERGDVRPDFSAFAAKGGKVLLLMGTADQVVPTATSEEFYRRNVAAMGATAVASFLKFYEVPGYGHSAGAFTVSWDSLTVLEDWVEKGSAPGPQVVRDANPGQNGRTRPLCEYPTWPKYKGAGDVNAAASYTCSL